MNEEESICPAASVTKCRKKTSAGQRAVMAAGYDDCEKRFIIRNSWGPRWGQKDYFTMPYAYVSDRILSDDIWTISRGVRM